MLNLIYPDLTIAKLTLRLPMSSKSP
ncbi:unnamed protein product, partial [Adineta steineri]